MGQRGAEQPKGRLVARKAPGSHEGLPCSQENLNGNDLKEQSGENWVSERAQSEHECDEQSMENWVTAGGTEWP